MLSQKATTAVFPSQAVTALGASGVPKTLVVPGSANNFLSFGPSLFFWCGGYPVAVHSVPPRRKSSGWAARPTSYPATRPTATGAAGGIHEGCFRGQGSARRCWCCAATAGERAGNRHRQLAGDAPRAQGGRHCAPRCEGKNPPTSAPFPPPSPRKKRGDLCAAAAESTDTTRNSENIVI